MRYKILNNRWVTVVLIAAVTLALYSEIQAQENKPRRLREEILQQRPNSTKRTPEPEKKSRIEPPKMDGQPLKPADPTARKNVTLIHMEKCENLYVDQERYPDLQILKGNVRFRHENALLYCDSAHFNDKANFFDAFGNVRIVQADTLTVYGDFLNYDGNTKMARVWDNVRLINKNTILTTDVLYYDRTANLAFYDTGGVVQDGENTLTSLWGQYSPSTKIALFKENVKMFNPESHLSTDTLKYDTNSAIADIVGNSLIVYKEETDIYSQRGWYDTKSDRMMLLDRSLVEQNDGKTLVGDTIFYDKQKRYGEAFYNVELNDPAQKTSLLGNFVSYDEVREIGLATDSALFVDWSTRDSLFLSADTLYSMKDSVPSDSVAYNKLLAYKNVRFYRTDLQGMADSLAYSTRDSIMNLRGLPVVWSANNQVMGQKISAFTKNQQIDQIKVEQSAIAIQKDSLMYFNQLQGKEMIAYLDSGELRRVFVNGNAETIFFPKDEKTQEYIGGVNKTISSYVTMYFKERKVERIVLTTASSGETYPLADMEENDLFLRNFYWYEEERPKNVNDLFTKYERTEPPKRQESTKKPAFPGERSGGASGSGDTAGESRSTTNTPQNISIGEQRSQSQSGRNANTGRSGLQDGRRLMTN